MGGDNHYNPNVNTANRRAGIKGLCEQSARIMRLAAAWKFLEDLEQRRIGVNEVENDAWNRAANRVVKKGYNRKKKKWKYDETVMRDRQYVGTLMKARLRQAREDWMSERQIFTTMKEELLRTSTDQQKNQLRRSMKQQRKENEAEFLRLRTEHKSKIARLEAEVKKNQVQTVETTRIYDYQKMRRTGWTR